MTTNSSVKKWGNNLALRIPNSIIQDLGLAENSSVQISSDGTVATIKPKKLKKATLDELVAGITSQNRHDEIDWGRPAGKEV